MKQRRTKLNERKWVDWMTGKQKIFNLWNKFYHAKSMIYNLRGVSMMSKIVGIAFQFWQSSLNVFVNCEASKWSAHMRYRKNSIRPILNCSPQSVYSNQFVFWENIVNTNDNANANDFLLTFSENYFIKVSSNSADALLSLAKFNALSASYRDKCRTTKRMKFFPISY